MKAPLALAFLAALPLLGAEPRSALPSTQPSHLPADLPYLGCDEYIYHEKLSTDYTEQVRSACRDCAALCFMGVQDMKAITLKRGEGNSHAAELEKLLAVIAVQPCWYERCWDEDCDPGLGDIATISFLNAAGRVIFSVEIWPAGPAFTLVDGEYVSLWELCRRHLPAPALDIAPVPPLPEPVYEDEFYSYIPMPAEENEVLRRALAACHELHIELWMDGGEHAGTHKIELSRKGNPKLAALLDRLAMKPQWLDEHLSSDIMEEPAYAADIRLLDAEGELLWEGEGSAVSFQAIAGEHPMSLILALEPVLPFSL